MISAGTQDVLAFPADLPALPRPSQPVLLADMDALSHGLAEGSATNRATDAHVSAVLERVLLTVSQLGSRRCPSRWAASTATARHHLDLMTRSANNMWSIRTGLDGTDRVLLEELEYITAATVSGHRGKNSGRPVDLVILIGGDHIYAPAVRRLRLLGVPTWVLQPGRFIAADLYKAATAVTRLALPSAA